MKVLVVLACLALGSVALADGHGGVFSTTREVTTPSTQGHGGVFSKPLEITASGGHGDVFAPVAN